MTKDLIIALLALLSIGSLAAVFILWAKLDEQKKLTQEEREKRWDEISRATSIEKELEKELEAEKGVLSEEIARLNECLDTEFEFADDQIDKNRDLQDKLSALLCPTNNHVWQDGVCVKCGRAKE